MMSSLLALVRDNHYCIQRGVFQDLSHAILQNISGRVPITFNKTDQLQAFAKVKLSNGNAPLQATENEGAPMQVTDYMGNAEAINYYKDLEEGDRIVNIVRLQGVMTRGGDACSYGSKDLCALLMRAADIRHTVGHVIVADTPGGMASTLIDFRHAINYCHERGQKVYLFADGDVASGGAFLSAMCDGTYFMNSSYQIGSLGMYCAFFSLADGAKNTITQETYREYYAEASSDKNKAFRQAANDDMSGIAEDIEHHLAQLLADTKQDRPSIKDKHLTGAMYPAKEVVGSLVDGFCSLPELSQLVMKDHEKRKGAALPRKEGAPTIAPKANKSSLTNNNNQTMTQYTHMAALIGEQPYESDKDGCVTLQPQQAEALEAKAEQVTAQIDNLSTENTDLKQTNQAHETTIAALQDENKQLKADVDEGKADKAALEAANARIAELEAAKSDDISVTAEKDTEIASLKEQLALAVDAKASLEAGAQAHEQVVADLKAEIAELKDGSNETIDAGEGPSTTGQGVAVTQMEPRPAHDSTKSMSENVKIQEEYNAKLRARRAGKDA